MPEPLYARKHDDDKRNEPVKARRGRLQVDVHWAYLLALAVQALLLAAILLVLLMR